MEKLKYLWLVVFVPMRFLRALFWWSRIPNFKTWVDDGAQMRDSFILSGLILGTFVHWSFYAIALVVFALLVFFALWQKEKSK